MSHKGKAKELTAQEIKTLRSLNVPDHHRLLFELGMNTGLRLSELLSLKTTDVFTEQGNPVHVIRARRLKKRSSTNIYSNIPVSTSLRRYLKGYAPPETEYLFQGEKGGPINRVTADRWLSSLFGLAGIQGASSHSMRRTFLSAMSRAGVPIRTIQEISGHSNLQELYTYLQVSDDDTKRAVNSVEFA